MTCCNSQLEQHADVTGSHHTDDGARLTAQQWARSGELESSRAREPARPRAWEAVREVVEVAPAEQADVARARAHDRLAAALGEHHRQQLVVDVGVAARAHLRRARRSAVPPVCRSIGPTRVEARAWFASQWWLARLASADMHACRRPEAGGCHVIVSTAWAQGTAAGLSHARACAGCGGPCSCAGP